MALPLADPEFWLVTAAAATALGLSARKIAKALRKDSEVMCDKCPKPRARAASSRLGLRGDGKSQD